MWEDAGLVRDERGLAAAASVLAAWRAAHRAPVTEAEYEDENLLVVAQALVTAALARRESVGAHYRRDFPAAETGHAAAEASPTAHASAPVTSGAR